MLVKFNSDHEKKFNKTLTKYLEVETRPVELTLVPVRRFIIAGITCEGFLPVDGMVRALRQVFLGRTNNCWPESRLTSPHGHLILDSLPPAWLSVCPTTHCCSSPWPSSDTAGPPSSSSTPSSFSSLVSLSSSPRCSWASTPLYPVPSSTTTCAR